VPAYLEWLDSSRGLVDNIRHVILAPGNMVTAEPAFLLYDEVREPQVYLAALQAIGAGSHWSRTVQVDVVALNWQERAILRGECK
jgi:uncharacterized protein